MRLWILFAIALLLAGCSSVVYEDADGQVEVEDQGNGQVNIEIEDGGETIEIEATEGADFWCQEGAEWNMMAHDDSVSWEISGLEEGGEFDGLCHVVYKMKGAGDDANIDYYFTEDGESGWMIMHTGGETFKQEWHN